MGSTGVGNFSDYSSRQPKNDEDQTGGSSGIDKCGSAFSVSLDEVARCSYFVNSGEVPPAGTEVHVNFNGIRLAVETNLGEEIGYLPTSFNYIKFCIDSKFSYGGLVTSSYNAPFPAVTVDIIPQ